MELISVKDLRKRYAKVEALKGVSLDFSGGIAGLIGPNGAGKTTLIKILVGLTKKDDGEAYLMGSDPWRDKGVLKRVGVLHEKPRLPLWASGRRYLEHVCRMKGVEEVEDEIRRVSRALGIENYLDRKISTYSAGMVQRVAIASSLVGDPELVIMDEPTANLDPVGRSILLEVLRSIRKERGTSFFISSHILSEVERICDGICLIGGGKVLLEGEIDEIRTMHSYVLRFRGSGELAKFLEREFDVSFDGEEFVVRSKDLKALVEKLHKYLSSGGPIPRMLELRPPTLEELFISLWGELVGEERSS